MASPARLAAALLLVVQAVLPVRGAAQPPAPAGEMLDGDDVRLRYVVRGAGPPVLLVHGFAISAAVNWTATGILDSLAAGYSVIAPDLRGHGASDKPPEPAAYGVRFVEDLVRLLDHLRIPRAHVVGYSMGGAIALRLLTRHPDRVISAVIGGAGWRPAEVGPPPVVREWLIRLDAAAREELTVSEALGGPVRAEWGAELRAIRVPVLAVFGEQDELVRSDVARLAGVLAGVEVEAIPGTDHFSVLGDPRLPQAILRFLDGR